MGHFDDSGSHDRDYDESLYTSAPQDPEDIIWAGSDSEQTPQEIYKKRLRYEKHARRYLQGHLPVLHSATLRGPLNKEWVNPWKHNLRNILTWQQPDLGETPFTRPKVMKLANIGFGHLTPEEAVTKCGAATNAQEASRGVNLEGNSATAGHLGNKFDMGYHSDNSEDPLSQEADMTHSYSDPIVPHSCRTQYFVAREQQIESGFAKTGTVINGEGARTKREADLKWLKGSSISKRARWDSPKPPSPSPMRDFQCEQVRQRGYKSTSTRISGRLQVHRNHQSKVAVSTWTHPESAGLVMETEEDFDELGDTTGETSYVSAVDSLRNSRATQSAHRNSTGDSDDDLSIATSSLRERASSKLGAVREGNSDQKQAELIGLPIRPRSIQRHANSNVEDLEGDSFFTEVAPSSGYVEKFKYRKRRRRTRKRMSADPEQDAPGQYKNGFNSRAEPIVLEREENKSNDDNTRPEISPSKEELQGNEVHQEPSPVNKPQLKEASPITDTRNTERETSPSSVKFDTDWDMLDDFTPSAESSVTQHLQRPLAPESERPLHTSTKAQSSQDRLKENVESLSATPEKEEEIIQSSPLSQARSDCELLTEDQQDTNSDSTEEILQSQIRSEMDISMHAELAFDEETIIENHLNEDAQLGGTEELLETTITVEFRRSPSYKIPDDKDTAIEDYFADKPAALVNSCPSNGHGQQGSGKEDGLQSPWTADNIQLPAMVIQADGHETHSINRSIQPRESRISGSGNQPPERTKTPENDGIIPFSDFMSPTLSPSWSRSCPSLGGFPTTQVLVEAATSNPWVKDPEPRPKKKVSFGLPEDEAGEYTTLEERPRSPPPPPHVGNLSQDDVFADGTTAVNSFQKHFAAVEGGGPKPPPSAGLGSALPTSSPTVSAMAEAFIAADREMSPARGQLASGDKSPSRHLQPLSDMIANSATERNGALSSRSSLLGRGGAGLPLDLDEFLGEAGGFLEEWSVEAELKKSHGTDGRERQFGEMW